MRLFIIDERTEAEVVIYGIDGYEHTEKFFSQYFADKGIKFLSEEEKVKYNTSADCGIYDICYEKLAEIIDVLQRTIDSIAEEYEKSGCDIGETYTFNGRCYVV
ncbi:MAG: hypothetical protein NC120_04940 [Ruminococcus sp.]|nr:hypothetical protein [Ruminococcus sp.]